VDLVFEGAALAVIVAGAAGLSHSCLIRDEGMPQVPAPDQIPAIRPGEPAIQAARTGQEIAGHEKAEAKSSTLYSP
jgi:hypothetical protein